jgi:phosphate-selective porin OprO/OprP
MHFKILLIATILFAANAVATAQTNELPSAPSSSAISAPASTPASAVLSIAAAPARVQPVITAPRQNHHLSFRRDGMWLSTEDGHTFVQVHGYVQADDRMFTSNIHGEGLDTFLFRRIRPLFQGTLFNNVDFRFMPDFGQNNPQIQEAYLELKTLPFAKLRAGKFKEPIGLEVLRQDRDLTFPERSIASDLVPLRYIGAQLSGSILSNSISYQGGYFDGSNDGSNGVFTQWASGNEGAARAFFHPFATTHIGALRQLGVGIGGSAGSQRGAISGLKTIGQTTFFKYSTGTVADGEHNRLAPQAYYYVGPFGLMGEYTISSQQVLNKGLTGRVRNEAWQVAGSFLLTGEKNGYSGVRPRNGFEPGRGFDHFGALELAVRYAQVRIGGGAFPNFANPSTAAQFAGGLGFGFNWYLTRYVKLQTDYEHTEFHMAPGAKSSLHSENVLINQIQLSF